MKQKLLSFILVFTLFIGVSHAQDFTVKGKVTSSSDGSAISGVSVIVQGTNKATQTDADGNYSISATANSSLVFRFVGFASQTIKVTRAMQLNVVMNNDEHALEEVVVVAYGSAKKESLTGSISSITSKDLEKRPITNALGALEGSAAGIQINNTSGQPGSEPTIRIRGFSSLNGSNDPLYVVDGVPFGGNVSDINPNDIEKCIRIERCFFICLIW